MELKNEPKVGLEVRLQKAIIIASIAVVLITIGVFTYINLSSSPDSLAGTQSSENTITGKVFCDVDQDGNQDNFENNLENVKVWLYEDTDGDGVIDAGEIAVDSTTTNSSGAYTFTTTFTSGSGSLAVRINSDNDDADEKGNGDVYRGRNYLKLNNRLVGLRFDDVAIPKGTSITSATVTFNAYSNDGNTNSVVKIYGDDEDDSDRISDDDDDISDRTPTSNSVSWSLPAFSTDQDYTSPNISSVVQEIVNRSGWKSGNDLTLIFKQDASSSATKKVTAHDYSSSSAPLLTVTYGSGSGSSNNYIAKIDTTSYSGSNLTTNGEISVSFSTAGTNSSNNNFGLANACGNNGKNIIRGWLFNDGNKNGNRDNGENDQSGVKVRLYKDINGNGSLDGNDELVDSTTTNGAGKYKFIVDYNQTSGSTITQSISTDNNDAEEDDHDGDVKLNGSSLDINKDIIGLRYTGISIPQGATISAASLTFTAKEDDDGSSPVKIYGEDEDDASSFSYSDDNLSDRDKTTAKYTWNIPDFDKYDEYETGDLSNIVQEIVDRSGWKSGNDMVFLVYPGSSNCSSSRKAYSRDNSPTKCPALSITYSSGSSSSNMYIVEIDSTDGIDEITTSPTISTSFTTSGSQTQEVESGVYSASSLPVDLMYIHASVDNNQAEIVWATASEENNSHFEVERSIDGYSFQTIGEEAGNGTSMNVIEYKYIDPALPKQEEPVFYRLKQVDFDGQYQYSPVVFVITGKEEQARVYPNPASSFIQVSKNGYRFSATLIDQSGNTIAYRESETDQTEFDATNMPNGFYVLQVSSRTGTENHKILIKH